MNPDKMPHNQGMELPPVTPEQQPQAHEAVTHLGTERNPELIPNNQAGTALSPGAAAQAGTPAAQMGVQTQGTPMTPGIQQHADPATATLIADDSDLIEKEWVERAKEIVHKTKDNPYLQNKAITKMKVDYIKKRYNKDIKLSEDT